MDSCRYGPGSPSGGSRKLSRYQHAQAGGWPLHTECNYFAIAANKLLEFKKWALSFGLCTNVDFREIDAFSQRDIRDLRNMREHAVDYFKGDGLAKDRWSVETPEYSADASSYGGPIIGGRLDWSAFGAAAGRLLPKLLAEPVPYPSRPNMPPPPEQQPLIGPRAQTAR